MTFFNPNKQPDKEELRSVFVGKRLDDLPTPIAVLDRGLVKANCDKMLVACEALNVRFRPHIKTHKVGFLRALSLKILDADDNLSILFKESWGLDHIAEIYRLLKAHAISWGLHRRLSPS